MLPLLPDLIKALQVYTVVGIICFKGSLEVAKKNDKPLLKLQIKLQDTTQVKHVLLFNDSAQKLYDGFPQGRVIEASEMQWSGSVLLSTPR